MNTEPENLVEKAITIAVNAHRGQRDKSGAAYILHPLRLMPRMESDAERVVAVLGNLQGIGQHRWTIRSETDVTPVAESILKMFREVGVPFLERFSSLDETRRAFTEDERFARLICPGREYRKEIIALFKSGTLK